MKVIIKALFFLVVLFIFSCKAEDTNTPTPAVEMPSTVTPPTTNSPSGNEQYLNEKWSYIFDQKKLPTFELTLPASDLAKIDGDPSAEEYVEGSLTFEGETLSRVGIRYKGSIGAFVGCLSGSDWANPSGSKTCTKLSMKIKINWEDPDARFYGLKKLQFHSQNNDDSQMRDRLGYWFFRQMEVPAPKAIHARLIVNGQYMGLFSLVEQIDGRFTRRNFEDGTGNLYKEIWPLSANGNPFPASEYINHLKTNEDENPTAAMISSFAQEVADANAADLQTIVAKWMNIDEVMAYAVVDRMIRNDDGAFHWYCNSGDCSPHNFFWYEEPTAGTMHLIPWDLDHAFENIIFNANPVTPIADKWGVISADCQPFSSGLLGLQQRSATCDKLIGTWASFTEEYEQKKQAFLDGPFSEENINEKLDEWSAQIRAATEEAHQTHGDAISIDKWESAVENLKRQLKFARDHN